MKQLRKKQNLTTQNTHQAGIAARLGRWLLRPVSAFLGFLDRRGVLKVPAFFLVRAAGWYGLSLAVLVISIILEVAQGFSVRALVLPVILALLLAWSGTDILYIAVKKLYFTREFVCVDTELSGAFRQLRNFIDPTSQTPFRFSKQAYFEAEDGTRATFTCDLTRKFHKGAHYLFYFRKALDADAAMTPELLEQLKIDHAILPAPKAKGRESAPGHVPEEAFQEVSKTADRADVNTP